MSSKLTKISIALLLSAVVAPSVCATIILSPEEEQAVRTAQPTTVKKIAQDAVSTATATGNQSNLDAYEQRLGESEENLKDALGVGGFTSIFEDINGLRTRLGLGTNIKTGIDALVTQAVTAGAPNVPGQTITTAIAGIPAGADDITARIDRQPPTTNLPDIDAAILEVDNLNAPAGTLTQAIGAVRGQINAPGVGSLRALAAAERARIGAGAHIAAATTAVIDHIKTAPTGGGDVALTLLDAQVALLDGTTPKLETALATTRGYVGATAGTINADFLAQLGLLNTMLTTGGANAGQTQGVVYAGSPTDLTAMVTFILTRNLSA